MNDFENQARIDLAAALRWAERFGYHESIANHFSFALDGDGSRFLLNPWGLHFSEVRASDLLVVDPEGTVLEGEGQAETSAVCIHGPIHARVPHARCWRDGKHWVEPAIRREGGCYHGTKTYRVPRSCPNGANNRREHEALNV